MEYIISYDESSLDDSYKQNYKQNNIKKFDKTKFLFIILLLNIYYIIMYEMANRPKILSNELDQAPKTHKAWYDKVIKSLKEDILKAMDQIILQWNDTLCDYINNNQNRIPVNQILDLKA